MHKKSSFRKIMETLAWREFIPETHEFVVFFLVCILTWLVRSFPHGIRDFGDN